MVFLDPFAVTLSDSHGNQVGSKTFNDSRTFYLWEEINIRARYVRIDSLNYEGIFIHRCFTSYIHKHTHCHHHNYIDLCLPTPTHTGARYFVLCAVEVFGGSSRHPTWPDLSLLTMKISKPGQSCKEACLSSHMICEAAYFRALNKPSVLEDMFTCNATSTISTQ